MAPSTAICFPTLMFLALLSGVPAGTEPTMTAEAVDTTAHSPSLVAGVLGEALRDALAEAALVLLVFAVTSGALTTFKRRKAVPKGRPKKAVPEPQKPEAVSRRPAIGRSQVDGGTALARHRQAPAAHFGASAAATAAQAAGNAKDGQQALKAPVDTRSRQPGRVAPSADTDALVAAVRAGRSRQLPQLLDDALQRYSSNTMEKQEAVAQQHLLSALRACASSRCFEDALAAYDHTRSRLGSSVCGAIWSILLYCAVEAGALTRGKQFFERLLASGTVSSHDFVNIVRAHALQRDVEGLKATLVAVRGRSREIDAFTWNRSLAACASVEGALELAEAIAAEDMCQAAMDAVGYNTLMKCNARAGMLARCLELRAAMASRCIPASEVTYGILLDACVGTGELERARAFFDELCASEQLSLNTVHCTTLIKGLVAAGRLEEALGVIDEMHRSPSAKPDLITYSTVVKAFADGGDVAKALCVLGQMLERGVRPDEIVYNAVLTGCCTQPPASDVAKAADVQRVFDRLVAYGLAPATTTLSILLKALAQREAWPAAFRCLEEAPRRFGLRPELRLYAQLAQSCLKARHPAGALQAYTEMLRAAKGRRERVPEVFTSRLLRQCALDGNLHGTALRILEAANAAGASVDGQAVRLVLEGGARQVSKPK